MVRETDDVAFRKDAGHGVFDRAAGILVDDPKHLVALPADRVALAPSGQLFGDRIHEFDAAMNVCRNHRVADALQSRFEPLALLRDGFFDASFFCHVAEHQDDPDDPVVRITNRRRAVGNWTLGPMSVDQHCMVGEADDVARPNDESRWIVNG